MSFSNISLEENVEQDGVENLLSDAISSLHLITSDEIASLDPFR